MICHVDCQVIGCQEVGAEYGYSSVGDDEFPFIFLSLHDEIYVDASFYLESLAIGCGDDWADVRLEMKCLWRLWDKAAACSRVDEEGIT